MTSTTGSDADGGSNRSSLSISDWGMHYTELYVVMAILILLSLSGTAGNALVMYVFSQKKDKLVSTLFILILALVDFVTCLVVIPYTVYMEFINFEIGTDFFCKLYQFLITSNIPFSVFIMVAIAVDRYFCICHPFLHATTIFRAKLAVAILAVLAAVEGFCVSLMYGVYELKITAVNETWLRDPFTNRTEMESYMDENYPDRTKIEVVYNGSCQPNQLLVSTKFQMTFQKCYTALYLVCLIVVAALYVLIYRSVLARRTRRQNEKSKSLSLVVSSNACHHRSSYTEREETLFTTIESEIRRQVPQRNGSQQQQQKTSRRKTEATGHGRKSISLATKWDMNRMANLKTAAMLFVVTVVFVVTFVPAFLMALQLIPYNMTVFYMYFANNVANPVIYSFMNKNFRDDTKRLFCR